MLKMDTKTLDAHYPIFEQRLMCLNLPEDLTVKQPLVLRAKYRQFVVD